jgi:hypothetical protein
LLQRQTTASKTPRAAAMIRPQELPESDCGSVSPDRSRVARSVNRMLTFLRSGPCAVLIQSKPKRLSSATIFLRIVIALYLFLSMIFSENR